MTAANLGRVRELERQLDEARQTISAMMGGQIDAIATSAGTTPVLLSAAQGELRDSRTLLRAVFDGAIDAMVLFDRSGAYRDVNPAACALFGRTRDELIGRVGADYYEGKFDVGGQRDLLHSSGRLQGELKIRRPTGDLRAVEFSAKTDIVPGLHLSVFRDITERKAAEESLQRAETDLRQAQKMEAVGRLAGGIAHDFNNLLCVILSYTTLIMGDLKPDDPLRDDLEEVQKAGRRSCDLTRQLLAFSRQQVLQPRVLVLNELVMGVQRMLKQVLTEAIDLVVEIDPTLGCVEVDPSQIDQVLMNLAVNARDAMPLGGRLTIRTGNVTLDESYVARHQGAKPGRHVVLSVTDTGTGMDASLQAKMFEPFFTTKEMGKGTGLGLATVLGIVQQSRGHVGVTSEPGKGTTFTVYFPRTDQPEMPTLTSAAPPPTLRGSETVLVVEDEEQVRAVVVRILRRNGYDVLEAVNGGDALLLCEQHPTKIDLMVTDVVMPRLSGRQLADRVGSLRPEMHVIYTSGYAEGAIVHHGVLDAGITFLQKPVTPDTLLRKVREVLDA